MKVWYVAEEIRGKGNHSDSKNAGLISTVWDKLKPGVVVELPKFPTTFIGESYCIADNCKWTNSPDKK